MLLSVFWFVIYVYFENKSVTRINNGYETIKLVRFDDITTNAGL